MAGFFYQLGRKVGPTLRKAKWLWAAAAAPEAEALAAEHAAGADLAAVVLRQHRLCAEPPLVELLNTTAAALTDRVKDKRRTFEFVCLAGDQPQAFCLPGGFVFVSRAMIELCGRCKDRLAFVLAHEIAHILEGHAMQRMLGSAALRAAARAGAVRHAAAGLPATLGLELLGKAYSRQQENDADALGLRLTCAAGFDGRAAVAVFEKLALLEQPDGPFKYFSTHPEAEERIAHLRRLLAQRQQVSG